MPATSPLPVPQGIPASLPGDFSSFTGQAQNPYLTPYYNQAADALTAQYQNAIAPGVLGQGIATGTFGSTGNVFSDMFAKDELGQHLASLAAQIYEPAYAQERQLQFGAASQQSQNALTQQGLANQLQLGQGELQLGGQSLANQLALGQGGLSLQSQGLNNALAIAQGQMGLQGQSLANALAIAQGQLQLGSQGQNIGALEGLGQLMLGAGNLGLGYQNSQNQALSLIPSLLGAQYAPSQALLNIGNQQQGQGQNILNAGYQNQYNQAMYPQQVLQGLAGLLSSAMGGGGTQVSVGPGANSGGLK